MNGSPGKKINNTGQQILSPVESTFYVRFLGFLKMTGLVVVFACNQRLRRSQRERTMRIKNLLFG